MFAVSLRLQSKNKVINRHCKNFGRSNCVQFVFFFCFSRIFYFFFTLFCLFSIFIQFQSIQLSELVGTGKRHTKRDKTKRDQNTTVTFDECKCAQCSRVTVPYHDDQQKRTKKKDIRKQRATNYNLWLEIGCSCI